jgi:hypothetical protein
MWNEALTSKNDGVILTPCINGRFATASDCGMFVVKVLLEHWQVCQVPVDFAKTAAAEATYSWSSHVGTH